MLIKLLVLTHLFLSLSLFVYSGQIVIKDYDQVLIFNNQPVVRVIKGDDAHYKDLDYNDKSWQVVSLPSKWQDNGITNWSGICWYRISVLFPGNLPGSTLGINLGIISDLD